MSTPKIKFTFDRKHVASRVKKGSVDLRITLDKKQKFISTGIAVYPKEWHALREEVVNTKESVEMNALLLGMKKRVYKILSDMEDAGSIDIDAIPTLLKTKNIEVSFLEYILHRSENKPVGEYAKKTYAVLYNKLAEYGKIVYFKDISPKTIRDFDEWLHAYKWKEKDRFGNDVFRHYSQATIGAYHKNLKAFIADAVVDGYLQENVYVARRIKVDKGEARIDKFLTMGELERIEKADMPTAGLSEARDLFLFACQTGLSYVDLMSFNARLITEEKGVRLYSGSRHKTNVPYTCVITRKAQDILDRYHGRLPRLPNQQYNLKLKLIAAAAGIDKPLSSHWARHTAAMVWLNDGIPMEVVSKCLGHSTIMMTQKVYAQILDKTIAESFKDK